MTYPPPPEQPGQGGFQYDPYGGQPGSQQPNPDGYSQPPPPVYGQQPPAPQYGAAPHLPPAAPGYPPQYGYGYGYPGMPGPKNGLGLAGMVTGIIGLALFWCSIVGLILAVLGIVFGSIGLGRANRGEATNKGMAIAGVALGCVAVVLVVLFWIFYGVFDTSSYATTV